jgi:hypothetical protein
VIARLPEHWTVLVEHLLRRILLPPTVVHRTVLEELPSFTKQRAQRAVHGRIVEQLTEQRYTEKQPIATKLLATTASVCAATAR